MTPAHVRTALYPTAPAPATGGGSITQHDEPAPAPATAPVLLDVRTPAEWRKGHVKGALHVPIDELRARLAVRTLVPMLAFVCSLCVAVVWPWTWRMTYGSHRLAHTPKTKNKNKNRRRCPSRGAARCSCTARAATAATSPCASSSRTASRCVSGLGNRGFWRRGVSIIDWNLSHDLTITQNRTCSMSRAASAPSWRRAASTSRPRSEQCVHLGDAGVGEQVRVVGTGDRTREKARCLTIAVWYFDWESWCAGCDGSFRDRVLYDCDGNGTNRPTQNK